MDEQIVNNEIDRINAMIESFEMEEFMEKYTQTVSLSTETILRTTKNPNKSLVNFYKKLTNSRRGNKTEIEDKFTEFLEEIDTKNSMEMNISNLLKNVFSEEGTPEEQILRTRLKTILEGHLEEEYILETICMGKRLGICGVENFLVDYLSIIKE